MNLAAGPALRNFNLYPEPMGRPERSKLLSNLSGLVLALHGLVICDPVGGRVDRQLYRGSIGINLPSQPAFSRKRLDAL